MPVRMGDFMTIRISGLIAGLAGLAVSACTGSPTLNIVSDAQSEAFKTCFNDSERGGFQLTRADTGAGIGSEIETSIAKAASAEDGFKTLNHFLNCYFAFGASKFARNAFNAQSIYMMSEADYNADFDGERRLLRSHVVVTLLAQLGAHTVTRTDYVGREEDAARLIGLIRAVEANVVAASPTMLNELGHGALLSQYFENPPKEPLLKGFETARRVRDILAVGAAVEEINIGLTVGRVGRAMGLVTNTLASGVTLGAVKDTVSALFRGSRDALEVGFFKGAFLYDGRETLSADALCASGTCGAADRSKLALNGKAFAKVWTAWSLRLEAACKDLASVSQLASASCLPGEADIKNALAAAKPEV